MPVTTRGAAKRERESLGIQILANTANISPETNAHSEDDASNGAEHPAADDSIENLSQAENDETGVESDANEDDDEDEDEDDDYEGELEPWKHIPLPRKTPSSLPECPKERAKLVLNLCDSSYLHDSPHWAEYIVHRQAADELTEKLKKSYHCDESLDPYLSEIRDNVEQVLKRCQPLMSISKDEWMKIADGVAVTHCNLTLDDICMVRDCEAITRIHSPVSTNSVDVHFIYHFRNRAYSTEWSYSLGFKINHGPLEPHTRFDYLGELMTKMYAKAGWQPFGWFWIDDKEREKSSCKVTKKNLEDVQHALFGSLAGKIDLITTARLILAAAGIRFLVATKRKFSHLDGYYTPNYGADFELELGNRYPGISAAHLRKICGIQPLEHDAKELDRLYDEDEESDSEDEETESDNEDGSDDKLILQMAGLLETFIRSLQLDD